MTAHTVGAREDWLAARLELLEAEKDLTRRSDEVARRRQELPWVRIDKEYRERRRVAAPRRVQGLSEGMPVAVQTGNGRLARTAALDRGAERTFLCVCTLLFAASAVITIAWCTTMSATGGMSMPGGWTMSMAWMRMPGQTWPGAAAAFLGMWVVMMAAMMLPSLVHLLRQYRQAISRTGTTRLGLPTALVGIGYFFVWAMFGVAVYPLGVAVAAIAMQRPAVAQAVPILVGAVVVIAGSIQFTAWKTRQLACRREAAARGQTSPQDAATAWGHGLRLGLRCGPCCANLMVILLVAGVMDLRAMAVVTAAITAERLVPAGERIVGTAVVGAGLFLIVRATGLV